MQDHLSKETKSDSIVLLSHGPSAYLVLPLLNRFQKAGYLRLWSAILREEATAIHFSLLHILNRQVINQRCLVNPGCGLVLDSHIVFLRCFSKSYIIIFIQYFWRWS